MNGTATLVAEKYILWSSIVRLVIVALFFNGIHAAVAYNVTNRKLTIMKNHDEALIRQGLY